MIQPALPGLEKSIVAEGESKEESEARRAANEALWALGNPSAEPSQTLDKIPAPIGTPLLIDLHCTEFTCRCPVTNQPDWATIDITYEPDHWLVESKSLKLYLETWRDEGIFHEHLAGQILADFLEQIEPISCSVTVNFNTRGGIAISARTDHYRGNVLPVRKSGKRMPYEGGQ